MPAVPATINDAPIKRARVLLDGLRVALLSPSPEEIGQALSGIDEAVRCLEVVQQEVRDGSCPPYEVRRELKLLKNDLRTCSRLVEHGLAFCHGWAKMIGSGPGYTSSGQIAAADRAIGGTLSLQG